MDRDTVAVAETKSTTNTKQKHTDACTIFFMKSSKAKLFQDSDKKKISQFSANVT